MWCVLAPTTTMGLYIDVYALRGAVQSLGILFSTEILRHPVTGITVLVLYVHRPNYIC